jgi:PAS domain S-box-containing protein
MSRLDLEFHVIADAIKDYAVFVLDPTGVILSWNEGASRIKGYRADEIIGRHFEVFYTAEARAAGRPRELLGIAEREGRVEEEGWRVRQDGSLFWADVVISAVRDGDGVLRGFAKITRDLSERRHFEETLRQSEERLRLMVESVRDYAIFLLDPDGRVETWNPGAEQIKGYRADEIVGAHFSKFYTPEDLTQGKPAMDLRTATEVGRYVDEGWRLRKDGTRFWANVVISAVRDDKGRLLGFTKVTRDLTDRMRAEEERLAAEREAAEQRVRVARTQEAVRERDEFISVAAHELRTPLTALRLKLDGAVRLAPPDSRLAERLAGTNRQVDRLIGLVERMLDMSRIVAGRLVLVRTGIDLGEVVREVVDDFRDQASHVRVELQVAVTGDAAGEWDRDRLHQVVTNLVSNAIKYGPGRPVDVTVRGDGDRVRLAVTDRGIGIEAEDLARIFDRFQRAAPVENYAGLGLGLHIARHIVEAHGGTISVASEPGQGSTFTVDLPRKAPQR